MAIKPLLLLLTGSLLPAQTQHQHHPPQSAHEYAKVLEDPARDGWQKPHEVLTALQLRPEEVVADIGAGSGYFSRRFAHHVAKVYAVDIDAKLLEITAKNSPGNVQTVLALPDDPKLAPASVDTIFICDVLHHIDNRVVYFGKLKAALKPGGRIVNIDFFKKPLPFGPPESMKLSEAEVIADFQKAGFVQAETFSFLPYQYFQVFKAKP